MFKVRDLEKADVIEPSWTDPQLICSKMNVSVKSGLGPFGLMVLASKNLEEYTSVYFRIFKARQNSNKYVVLMCSDQSRYVSLIKIGIKYINFYNLLSQFTNIYVCFKQSVTKDRSKIGFPRNIQNLTYNFEDFLVMWIWDRSSLKEDNDKTTYGAFVDINPHQPLSLRALVIKSPILYFTYIVLYINLCSYVKTLANIGKKNLLFKTHESNYLTA